MKKNETGQLVIIVAVLLMVILLFLAVIIDGTRLILEQEELNRVADAAGKAGLIIVGDRMVTQVVEEQTKAASVTVSSILSGITPGYTSTPTISPGKFSSWLNEDHRKTLVAPPMQTLVATQVLGSAEENGLGLSNPSVQELEIIYPYHYDPIGSNIYIKIRIKSGLRILFHNYLDFEEGVLIGDSEQGIPQY